ncbi:helix-turn-helix protein [Melghiribacillus thermohalophilus]|uniref:Helix-turn-helix protein n=1 Tax=Melghiribacillus thermohalophilus TaxID=1324956 RepID=A0A4R3N504_9BACI|nr:helix-turn-helix transcriptional regulator [Melghiribacillus thermohalophilus]TCT23351.1 helix-turn-helix protein [Melghiribacillus thermohalophilus]
MIGDKLRKLRNEYKLTQTELASKLGISRGTYAHYEINKRQPDYATLKKIADYFNVSVDYLLGRTDDPNPWVSKESGPEDEFDPIREINKLLKKYGIESSGFFDIEQWKAMGPEDIEKVESYFKYIAEEAKKRNQQDDADFKKKS